MTRDTANKLAGQFGLQNKKNQANALTPEALQNFGQLTYQAGMKLPANLGMMGGGMKTQIMNKAAEIAAANGDTSQAAIGRQMAITAGTGELTNLQKQRGTIEAFAKTSKVNLQNYLDASKDFVNSGVAWANKPIQWLQQNIGSDPAIAKYLVLHHVAVNEAARVLQGNMSGVLTDNEKAQLNNVMNAAYTPAQTNEVVKGLLQDIDSRESGFESQINQTKAGVFDAQSALKSSNPPPTQPNSEIERKDFTGRVGIFDANTKKFLRYK